MVRRIALAAGLVLSAVLAWSAWPDAPWTAVDGDTVRHGSETIRLQGIDAPETRQAKCPAEKRLGLAAKRRLQELLATPGAVVVFLPGKRSRDKYGRLLGDILVDGRDVGSILIGDGLARPWRGRRAPWCP